MLEQPIRIQSTEQPAQSYAEPAAAPTPEEIALLDSDLEDASAHTANVDLETLHAERTKLFEAVSKLRSDDPNEVTEALDNIFDTEIIIKGTAYTFLKKLGGGSFGDVFVVAPEEHPDQTFVLKLSQPFDRMAQYDEEFDNSDDKGITHAARQFLREIAISKQLTKDEERPPCPKYVDAQLIPNPENPDQRIAAIIMERIQGITLSKIIEEAGNLQDYPEDLLDIASQYAQAIKYVHDRNAFHSDIQLDNAMLDDDGRVMLIDFGAATYKELSSRAAAYKRELPNSTIGDDDYLPLGDDITASEARDVYALGRSIQHMIFGEDFKDLDKTYRSIGRLSNDYVRRLATLSTDMTEQEASDRPSIDEVIRSLVRLKEKFEQSQVEAAIAQG